MKRFLLLLLVCVLGYFFASYLMEDRMPHDEKIENKGRYSSRNMRLHKMVRNGENARELPVSTVSLLLNLSEAEAVSSPEKLVTVQTNCCEFGLLLTKEGLVGNWEGRPWNVEPPLPLSALFDNDNVVRQGQDEYLALSVIVNSCTDKNLPAPGITVIDSSGKPLKRFPGLGSFRICEYQKISIDKKLVEFARIHPRPLTIRAAGRRAAELEKKAFAAMGNPFVVYGGGAVILLLLTWLWSKLGPAKEKKA